MNLDDRVINFYRAGIGLATSAICLAFLALIGFLLINRTAPFSIQAAGFIIVLLLLAVWFGKLSYQLIFQASKEHTYLFSPTSIIVIFSLVGLGALSGAVFRLSTGDFENGLLSVLILLMLFPLGHFCWEHAKNNSGVNVT
ncbi:MULTISPECIES: hypothetical protein [unclassified Colwellia]|uniref:hypothetical protein n=1 Tax=unclassified Colwellia TaxID=196834 RepID=UPI0015F436DF|nr:MULTISPECIES: hypothetical protein [unclassified Colwellia]MBA6231447.1 hypothetical protein [Colwellia sp. MB02u-7]MBA6235006.1 hypothetical protein [Colwellia sp. MB02u-11]MBA6298785.1 hypothetical protein [Colwellia sp. MB3u-22]MBA6309225.1 hypothetical protein [Colwellia sp. MB3u-64]